MSSPRDGSRLLGKEQVDNYEFQRLGKSRPLNLPFENGQTAEEGAPLEQKVNCLVWLAELKSIIAVQRRFRTHYNKEVLNRNSIHILVDKKVSRNRFWSGRPSVSEESVTSVEQSFVGSPRKSLERAFLELGLPKSTVHKILLTKLKYIKCC